MSSFIICEFTLAKITKISTQHTMRNKLKEAEPWLLEIRTEDKVKGLKKHRATEKVKTERDLKIR